MRKKITIISLLILLLIPFKISAYTYKGTSISKDTLINNNYIKKWPDTQNLYVSNTAYITNTNSFRINSVINGSNVYIGHSANINKNIGNDGAELDLINTFDTLENNDNNLSPSQKKLLEDLILNGFQFDTTNTQNINSILSSKSSTLSMMAMQILVWEIMEGGRTTFTTVQPDNITSTTEYNNSLYKKLVYENGGETNESDTLYFFYKKIVESVDEVTNETFSPAFNTEIHALTWDGTKEKYSATISGLGKYKTCSSSDSNVTVSTNESTAVISSNNIVDLATITCSYAVGGGTNDEPYFFKFKQGGNCQSANSCSSIIYGSGRKVYTKSFGVTSKSANFKIKNVSLDKKELSNSVFKLTHRTTTSYSININANDTETSNINKGGEFIVSQVSVPSGYEKVPDFNIKIDTSDNSIKDCTNKGTDNNGNTTCANGRVIVTKSDDTLLLTIYSLSKNFKVIKVNEKNEPINGTTFKIKNSKNEEMKFKLTDGLFTYDTSGNSNIVLNNTGTYAISTLPSDTYQIIETSSVSPYRLPSNESERITKIKIDSEGDLLVYDEGQKKYITAVNSSVQIKNYRTLVKIASVNNGSTVSGASYSLYKDDKTTLVKSTKTQDGVYAYSDDQSDASATAEYITSNSGYIYVYDLPIGKYYFKNNDNNSDAWIEVNIDVTKTGATVNGSRVINTLSLSATKNSFSFYKTDEDGNYISGGKFKLQRYDSNKARYVDLKLVKVDNDGTYNEKSDIFKESDDGKRVFSPTNGIATFIEMKSGSDYRIVEQSAPKGYELQSVNDTATVTIDGSGNAYGLLVLSNKKLLQQTGAAQAELIINIDTGQTRIKYTIIISSIVVIIIALFILQKKKK